MKAFIFTGGNIVPENINEKREKDDMVIVMGAGDIFKTFSILGI